MDVRVSVLGRIGQRGSGCVAAWGHRWQVHCVKLHHDMTGSPCVKCWLMVFGRADADFSTCLTLC